MQEVDFLVVGCGPAGGTAAREAARSGIETLVLERDSVVGVKRVCAAGLRPGFCEEFDLPRSIVHCDPPTISVRALSGRRYDYTVGQAHTTTREELDGTIAALASKEGAHIATQTLFRSYRRDGDRTIVEYADLRSGERKQVGARAVLLAQGSSARFEDPSPLAYGAWSAGLITCYQYRVYLERPATGETYRTLEMHYYLTKGGRNVIAWMFPKRDHLSIGLGIAGKCSGKELRAELDAFVPTVAARLFPGVGYTIREEGNLLYGGAPRPRVSDGNVMVAGTAAGLVDATTGEGIHEAAMSGRLAAEAVAERRRGSTVRAAQSYERRLKDMFYGRLRHRHKLMTFLERKPVRFDVLFEQLARTPRFADMLQRDRNDFTLGEWMYLYAQAALFSVRALRA
ncbi:MAG: geranylgeranyl diphosphate reductase [Vulcanimicrobiaceae bacterium]